MTRVDIPSSEGAKSADVGGRRSLPARIFGAPVHPFLIAAHAVFFLWAANVDKVVWSDVVGPLVVVLGGTAVLYVIARLLLRESHRAALVLSVFVFLFFSYGHFFTSGKNDRLGLALWGLLGLGTLLFVAVKKPEVARVSLILNVIFAVLLLSAGFTIASTNIRDWNERRQVRADSAIGDAPEGEYRGPKRDIYMILLDRYAGSKTLREHYGYDNSAFIAGLRDRGFYVADGSRAPYPKTPHSIQTTLNMDYIDFPSGSSNWRLVYDSLKSPRSAEFLKQRGYKYVLMGSGYHSLRRDPFADVNVAYAPGSSPVLSEFATVLYESTVLDAVSERYNTPILDARRKTYERVHFQYQQVARVAKMKSPTFMFAHILAAHEPFVIDSKGKYVTEAQEQSRPVAESYVEAVKFEETRTLELIDDLLAGPPESDPIIVLQSDEGPGPARWRPSVPGHYDWTKAPQKVLHEKFRILNAYHMPGVKDPGLHPNISPANSFRVVFNTYFDADLPLLPDRSYVFRNELEPYAFIDVTERVKD